ncbi:hypothetical protein LAC81_23535 [Ensifer adhaerens]|uniref:hypothetical protein n=1 Tax=Ensifer adhaerens TaxID=106592 RepID=UPI001CBE71B9|nr:hypothetical protein [Ensifer adhaerens]MBZ7926666.1 hypothetical protein [Ensifer adhaerens]UAX97007.1 hypothetical protein LAC78_24945 [Ensifer adhaerens]UAY03647.1 hypothetical protein LAC80_34055 [Ensifer adhaerens]UAY11631.1 hypothetical protein LAC81_23535 [Ensifer adhaerens]
MPVVPRSKIRQRLLIMLVTGIGGMAAAAVSFATAVYDAANPAPAVSAAKGEAVDTGRWLVTINDATMASVPPTGTKPFEPKRFLMVDLDLDNRSVATSNAFMNLITIRDGQEVVSPKPIYYLARDKWIASAVNPNMPEKLIAVWEWPPDRPEPEKLSLSIGKQIYKPRDNLYGAPNWFDDGEAAVVELAVSQAAETTEQ